VRDGGYSGMARIGNRPACNYLTEQWLNPLEWW
jgi:hypothetical protein